MMGGPLKVEKSSNGSAHRADQMASGCVDVDDSFVREQESHLCNGNSSTGTGRIGDEENCKTSSARRRPGEGYDAIVVGSGYGGSVAACRLAQAGLKVCVLEKGRRWEAPNFPDTFWKGLRNTTFNTPVGTLGQESGLYQVNVDGDCMAVTAAGVGGGSLISAGVMVRTPKRTRNDPHWPKEWEDDWSTYESMSLEMLEPEFVPNTFPKKKIMDVIAPDELEDVEPPPRQDWNHASSDDTALQLSVRFKEVTNKAGVKQGPCVACGNCIVGCNFNAKGSTDKSYLAAAIQAGAHVSTQSKVLFIAENPIKVIADWLKCNGAAGACRCGIWRINGSKSGITAEENVDPQAPSDGTTGSPERRWRVYLDEVSFLSADIVILGAGVLGTNEILLRSRQRGLRLSDRLGKGVSCNGNNIGFASGSPAPLQGYGVDCSSFASTPVSQRPGPSICNSYTSSAGYTIQGAAYPRTLPYFFLRVWTYGCDKEWLPTIPSILWAQLKVWARTKRSSFMVLNMIGYDESDGEITLDRNTDRLRIVAPHDPTMVKKISACQRLAKRIRSRLYVSRFRSTAVHLLGGCGAAHDPLHGVANPDGHVFDPIAAPHDDGAFLRSDTSTVKNNGAAAGRSCGVHPGLFVCDGSLLPCSVGVNPSATITAVAERVAAAAVRYAQRELKAYNTAHSNDHLVSRCGGHLPRENGSVLPPQPGKPSAQSCSQETGFSIHTQTSGTLNKLNLIF